MERTLTRVMVGTSAARDGTSCRDRVLTEHGVDPPPPVDPAQLDLRTAMRREWRRLEQRLERAANPAGVAPCQVGGDPRFVHLRQPPLIARKDPG